MYMLRALIATSRFSSRYSKEERKEGIIGDRCKNADDAVSVSLAVIVATVYRVQSISIFRMTLCVLRKDRSWERRFPVENSVIAI